MDSQTNTLKDCCLNIYYDKCEKSSRYLGVFVREMLLICYKWRRNLIFLLYF